MQLLNFILINHHVQLFIQFSVNKHLWKTSYCASFLELQDK